MRKILIAAASVVALAAGAAGVALAQNAGDATGAQHGGHRGGFFQADTNGDGVITRQEFDASRATEFARLDANNDGQLTRDEMRSGMRGMRGGWRGHRGGGMHALARLDTNNDGNISRDEFLARPLAMFSRLDKNNDGIISADERPQPRQANAEGGQGGQRGERPNFDTNGDHQISRAEFDAMGARMFERLDANHDGRVTRDEMQAARPHRGGPPPAGGQ